MRKQLCHLQAPLNKYTFNSPRIRKWVEDRCSGRVLNLFAGKTLLSVKEVRNDIRLEMPAAYHYDAVEFVKKWTGKKFNTIILDPPYSYRKSMEMYGGATMSAFNYLKNLLPDILAPEGQVITLGYHSVSMGKSRGFVITYICLISHGGAIHDTIITVEEKI